MSMRLAALPTRLCACVLLLCSNASAQSATPHWRPSFGALIGEILPTHLPYSAPAVGGIAVGADYALKHFMIRPSMQIARSFAAADDISICLPAGIATGCFDPIYARTYLSASSAQPFPQNTFCR